MWVSPIAIKSLAQPHRVKWEGGCFSNLMRTSFANWRLVFCGKFTIPINSAISCQCKLNMFVCIYIYSLMAIQICSWSILNVTITPIIHTTSYYHFFHLPLFFLKKTRHVCWGQTPLHVAALYSHLDAAQMLLDKGANAKARDAQGRGTPPETDSFAPENRPSQKETINRIPTIHFQVLLLLVSGRVIFWTYTLYLDPN